MFCKNCGKEVADGLRFCPACGGVMEEAPVYDATPQDFGVPAKKGFVLNDQMKKLIPVVAIALVVVILAIIFLPKLFGGNSAEDLAIKAVEAELDCDMDLYDLYYYDYFEYRERKWSENAADNDMTLEAYIQEKAFDEGFGSGISTVEEYYEAECDAYAEAFDKIDFDYDLEAMVKKEYSEDENPREFREELEYIRESQAEYGLDSSWYGIDVDDIDAFADVNVFIDGELNDMPCNGKAEVYAVKINGSWKLVDFDVNMGDLYEMVYEYMDYLGY